VIQYFTPFSLEKKIGKAYNESMSLLPNEEDFACLRDGDTMFLTPDYGKQIADIIEMYKNHNVGIFTCLTNRIKNKFQLLTESEAFENKDITYHKKLALKIKENHYLSIREIPRSISGFCMIIQKKTWIQFGGFKEIGMLAIDNDFSRRVLEGGKKIYCMQGVYMFHYYRLLEGQKNKKHLI
jgi:GT2 family glycosyltransferase